MSTITEEKPSTATGEDALPEWAIGYSLILPCDNRTPQCDKEAEWFGNQHGCIKAHVCDQHMQECYRDVCEKIEYFGAVECRICKQDFKTFSSFLKAVRI